jgi:peptidoglycan/LPS O-acetylase OafA/YrhL
MAKDIRSLTGIRGVAATWVVLYHVHEWDDLHGVAKTLLTHGYLAVDLFFLLSGFVMALSYGGLATAGWSIDSYRLFLTRRFARVYPLYLVVICAIAVTILAGWSRSALLQGFGVVFLANAALVQTWLSLPGIDGPAWSISTEFAAYLLFPVLAASTLTTRRPGRLAAVFVACSVALCLLQFAPHLPGDTYRMGPLDLYGGWPAILRCLTEFTIGLALYRMTQFPEVLPCAGRPLVGYAVAAVLLALLCTPGMDVPAVLAMAPFLLVLAADREQVARLMGSRVVFFMGEISYSMYLLHVQFLRLRKIGDTPWLVSRLGETGAHLAAVAVVYASIILCSWLTYAFIEKPCRAWFRRTGRSARKRPLEQGTA